MIWSNIPKGIVYATNYAADGTDLSFPCIGLFAEAAGAVKITDARGASITLTVAAGESVPVRIQRVWTTGTTVALGQLRLMVAE